MPTLSIDFLGMIALCIGFGFIPIAVTIALIVEITNRIIPKTPRRKIF